MGTLIIVVMLAMYFLVGFVVASVSYILKLVSLRVELIMCLFCWPILILFFTAHVMMASWIKLLDKICIAIDSLRQQKEE